MTHPGDIVIVGGGPVGALLALALAARGYAPVMLEPGAADAVTPHFRPLALSYGSRLVLERLNVWQQFRDASAIERIHVSQQGGFGRVALDASEAGLPALGYVVDYARLRSALAAALAGSPVQVMAGATVTRVRPGSGLAEVEFTHDGSEHALGARLIAVADGGALQIPGGVRQTDYRQSAVATIVSSELPHRNAAFERFTANGPLALLPCAADLALIWTTAASRAQELCELPEAEFLAQLRQEFGGRLGAFTAVGARAVFPLVLRMARDVVLPRIVLIGNAAQTLHPVAGQGFNLGLRDAWELAEIIARSDGDALGSDVMLADYRARRRLDRTGAARFTDTLVRLFSSNVAPLRFGRGAGLALLGCVPPLKDFVIRRMTFGSRG